MPGPPRTRSTTPPPTLRLIHPPPPPLPGQPNPTPPVNTSPDHPIFKHTRADRTGRTTYGGLDGQPHPDSAPTPRRRSRRRRRRPIATAARRALFAAPVAAIGRALHALVGLPRLMFSKLLSKPKRSARSGSDPAPLSAGASRTTSVKEREKLVAAVLSQALKREADGRTVLRSSDADHRIFADVLVAGSGEPKLPDEVFPRLKWGGVFAYVGTHEQSVERLAEAFDGKRGFVLEQPPTAIHAAPAGVRIPGITPQGTYFTARKTALIQPGDTTDRFTYEVHLTRQEDAPNGYIVTKQVPTYAALLWRLKKKFPGQDPDALAERARKLVDTIFPTFLTREAAILKILAKHLPEPFNSRVPSCLDVVKNDRGMVTELTMNWLRNGGKPLPQIDFARQAAELLTVLHDHARVIHLDLRLDNFVITEEGVGFVDFGSACRIGEDLGESPMIETLFSEMMRTSQIQRMLGKMLERGDVTNNQMREVHGKVDKTVDAFYLAVQIAKPTNNPELRQLIDFNPNSEEAQRLKALTAAILRPKNPHLAEFKTAADILRGIRRIEARLQASRSAA
ncbi:MAG: hypothetical protein AAF750_04155 [Planctomycetota bacterium]